MLSAGVNPLLVRASRRAETLKESAESRNKHYGKSVASHKTVKARNRTKIISLSSHLFVNQEF